MPDLDLGAGDRGTVDIAHLASQPHHLSIGITAVVHARKAFRFRGAGHVERAFDGARRAASALGFGIDSVLAQVKEVVKAEPWRKQAELGLAAQGIEQVNTRPILFLGDIEVVDQLEQVAHQAVDNLLGAVVAAGLVETGDSVDKFLDFGSVKNLHGHGVTLSLVFCRCLGARR